MVRTFTCISQVPENDSFRCRRWLAVHLIVGILVGLLFYGVGNEATGAGKNMGFIFFNQLFLMYTAMMATVLTCEL